MQNKPLRVALERDGYREGRLILATAIAVVTIGALIGAALFGNP